MSKDDNNGDNANEKRERSGCILGYEPSKIPPNVDHAAVEVGWAVEKVVGEREQEAVAWSRDRDVNSCPVHSHWKPQVHNRVYNWFARYGPYHE